MNITRICAVAALVSQLPAAAACGHRAPESRVRSVQARVDGITCPTCVPPLKASLAREYEKSAIEVDDDKDTATVTFADGDSFSASQFNRAVERVLRMRVVTLRVQACGTLETANGSHYLNAGKNRFLVHTDRDLPANQPICADGTLDSRSDPATFEVSAFSVQGTEHQ